MKTPDWHQRVLLLTRDEQVQAVVATGFGGETELKVASDSAQAVTLLEGAPFEVLIIDISTSDPKRHWFEDKQTISFLEVSQFGAQQNQGITIIVLANKLLARQGDFARKCGATLIMDRKQISVDVMNYMIRELRKRTFRTVLMRDLFIDDTPPVDVFHYLSLNSRYAPLFRSGEPIELSKLERLKQTGVTHVYVREPDFPTFLDWARTHHSQPLFTVELALIRERLKNIYIRAFDTSNDGSLHFGKQLLDDSFEVVANIQNLILRFPSQGVALAELPYPRWSGLAHSMNTATYSLLFGSSCGLSSEAQKEIAVAGLFHNIGLSEIPQRQVLKSESELNEAEREIYARHPALGVEILKRNRFPFTPTIEQSILLHHENFDGSGFPQGLSGTALPLEPALLSAIGSFDHFKTIRPGEKSCTVAEAWSKLQAYHRESSYQKRRFHPKVMSALEGYFGQTILPTPGTAT